MAALIVVAAWLAFTSASDNVKAASIAGFLSVLAVFIGRYFEQRREIKLKVSSEKVKVYENVIEIMFSFLASPKSKSETIKDGAPLENDLAINSVVNNLRSAQKDLIFWGSDNVIKAWMEFQQTLQQNIDVEMSTDRLALSMARFGGLIIAMRRDVGYPFTNLTEQKVASMILAPGIEEQKLVELVGKARP